MRSVGPRKIVIRSGRAPAAVPLGQRGPVVDAEQVGIIGWRFVLDEEHHVVHQTKKLGRDVIECLSDSLFELLSGHLQHIGQPATMAG